MPKDNKVIATELHQHPIVQKAVQVAAERSSLKRTTTDVSAGGGIDFELAFQEYINRMRGKTFPYLVMLKKDFEINRCTNDLKIDWGPMKSFANFKKQVATAWSDQANADVIWFRIKEGTCHYSDAWSIKTTIQMDVDVIIGSKKWKDRKTPASLDLVNVKNKEMSKLLKNAYQHGFKTTKLAGRCLLVIADSGLYDSYFWDGRMSEFCKMMAEDGLVVTNESKKKIGWKDPDGKKELIGCSTRVTTAKDKGTSFGRSLNISTAPTKAGRKANFMAERLADHGVFSRITGGTFTPCSMIIDSFRKRLNLKNMSVG